jgi:hypothetical protein
MEARGAFGYTGLARGARQIPRSCSLSSSFSRQILILAISAGLIF